MDYGKPDQRTALWKYQWDLIHNPEKILFSWTQDEEEGAFMLYESFVTMEFEDVFSHFEENKRPKPWEYVYLDKTLNQWGFYMAEFESSVKDYFSSIAVNSKYFTDQQEIDVFRQYYYYDFLFRSYTSYLISFFNSTEIDRKEADRLKKVFYTRAHELEGVSKAVVSQYTDILLTKQKEERILAERKREYEQLKASYQREKENQALIRNYSNAMIGLTTVGVTVLTGGTGTVFWVTLVGGGISFVGNTAQMFIRLSDNSQLKSKLGYIPTDYNDVVFCSITCFIGDSEELQTANAVFDVVEGVIFLKLNPDIVSGTNVVIQGVEVYQDIEISK
ncbi:hypothetical protein ACT29H_16610 [Thermophagus sp. OGC60D27]|uniref:hypothetical protein n=1 Tax=Thermophagus sp. OGC60D27 TaxID=3458415 RepID=UPI004037F7D2